MLSVAIGCEKRPPPPVVVPAPPVVVVPDAAMAEVPAPVPQTSADHEAEPNDDPGLPDDPIINQEAVEGVALRKLLLRDPEKAAKALEALPMPDAWQISLIAQLALKRGNPGPDIVPESPLPDVLPENPFTADAGTAYVGTALLAVKTSGKAQAPTVVMLPINTSVTVTKVEGSAATIAAEIVTDVEFASSGSTPTGTHGIIKTGVVDVKWLVSAPVEPEPLKAIAETKKTGELEQDETVVLRHRVFLIERTERARAALIEAAWAANRAAWVVNAAMAQLHVAPKRIDVAWVCKGELLTAKWLSFASGKLPKLPDSMCLSHVDLRKPCSEKAQATWQQRSDVLAKAGLIESPMVQLVIDATRPRVLWFYSIGLRTHDACASTPEVDLDPHSARVRRLVLPLGTAKTVVRIPFTGYVGTEFGVVAAPSEAKARAWLRKRSKFRWTPDEKTGELNISLGVADLDFEGESDVTGATYALPAEFECDSGC